jgi:hypothetical protein
MSCQVAPLWTVRTFVPSSSDITLNPVISSTSASVKNAWPPILCRTPAIETFRLLARAYSSALLISSSVVTRTIPWTAVRFRQLASLSVPPRCDQGSDVAAAD